MSSFRIYIIRCDADGCAERFEGSDRAERTRTTAAVQHGWISVVKVKPQGPCRVLDFCRDHVDQAEGREPLYPVRER